MASIKFGTSGTFDAGSTLFERLEAALFSGRKLGFVMVVGFKQRVDLRTLRRIGARCAAAAREISRRMGAKVREPA